VAMLAEKEGTGEAETCRMIAGSSASGRQETEIVAKSGRS